MKKFLLVSLLTSLVVFVYVATSNQTAIKEARAAAISYIKDYDRPIIMDDSPKQEPSPLQRPVCPKIEFMESPEHDFILVDKKKWYGEVLKHLEELHLYARQLEQLLDLPPAIPKRGAEPDSPPAPSKPSPPKKKLSKAY